MSTDKTIFTWPQLLEHLEVLWGRPQAEYLPELLPYLRHELIANMEPVLVGAKVLTSLYELPPTPQAWLKECIQAADEWVWGCRQISDGCIAENAGDAEQCQCYLAKIGPLFKESAALLARCPEAELAGAEPDVVQIFGTVKSSLNQLVIMVAELERNDLTWLKAIFDEHARKKGKVGGGQ